MVKRQQQKSHAWKIFIGCVLFAVILISVLTLLLQGKNIAVLNPQGIVGQNEKNLIIFTVILSVLVIIPVYIIMATVAIKYREGNTKAKYTPDEDGNKWLEALWWGLPIVVIGILSAVTVVSTHQLDPYKPLNSKVKPINVQVVALQWRWLFLYPDQHIATMNELKIPAGTPINFQLTADAPMSAFWIPNLGTQTYAMTGMTSQLSLEADHTGTYRGTNSNINGKGYADMNFKVTVVSPRDFTLWAQTIPNEQFHNHLEWDEYKDMAKPSMDETVAYYHLHDISLFSEVLNKYTGNGSMSTMNMSHNEANE